MLRIYTINSSTHNERPKLPTGVPSSTCHCRKSGLGRSKHLHRDCVTHRLHSSSLLGLSSFLKDPRYKPQKGAALEPMGKPKVSTIGVQGPQEYMTPTRNPCSLGMYDTKRKAGLRIQATSLRLGRGVRCGLYVVRPQSYIGRRSRSMCPSTVSIPKGPCAQIFIGTVGAMYVVFGYMDP